MRVLLLNGSPKQKFSASGYFLGLLGLALAGCKTTRLHLSGPRVYSEVFAQFAHIDALVIAMPVYVDSIPSHMLRFLAAAEEFCRQNPCSFKVYLVSNCGFYESRQCKNQLACMQSFCRAAGLEWGAGLGIATGEMLSVLRLTPLLGLTRLLLSSVIFLVSGNLSAGLATYPWIPLIINVLVYLVFSLGLFLALGKMGLLVRRGRSVGDYYALGILCPRFLFTIMANTYWIIRASYNGVPFWSLYKRISLTDWKPADTHPQGNITSAPGEGNT